MNWSFVAGVGAMLAGCGLYTYVRADTRDRQDIRDGIRNLIPLLLFWLGLRLMNRRCRVETIHSIQHRHSVRGLPDLYEGVRDTGVR